MDAREQLARLDDPSGGAVLEVDEARCGPARRCRRGGRCGPAGRTPARPPRRGPGDRRGPGSARSASPRRPSRPAGRHRPPWCPDSRSSVSARRSVPCRSSTGSPASSGAIEVSPCVTPASASGGSGRARSNGNMRQPIAARACAFSGRRVVPRISQPLRREAVGQGAGGIAEPEAEAECPSRRRPFLADPLVQLASAMLGAEVAHPRGRGKPRRAPRPPHPAPAASGRPAVAPPPASSAGSPLLPIAISTLRTNRSRPMRLTGLPAKRRRKPASSKRGELGQRRCDQVLARLQLHLVGGLRVLVPRADGEAVVAAVDPVAHQRPQLARDRALVLDGQVADAAPRIEPVGRREGVGRADVEAAAAAAAMVALGLVRRQRRGRSGSRPGTARSRARG